MSVHFPLPYRLSVFFFSYDFRSIFFVRIDLSFMLSLVFGFVEKSELNFGAFVCGCLCYISRVRYIVEIRESRLLGLTPLLLLLLLVKFEIGTLCCDVF